MKRLILLVMILVMMPITVLAADKTIFSVTSGKGSKGDVVSIYVKMQNNDKFGMLGIKLNYDKDALSYEKGSFVSLKEDYMKGIEENNGVITIYALALEDSIVVKDSLAKIDFKIKDDTKSKIEIGIKVTDYGKDEVTPLKYEVKNGEIVINSNNDKNSSKNDETDKKNNNDKKNDIDKKQSNDDKDSDDNKENKDNEDKESKVTEDKEENEDNEDKREDEKIEDKNDDNKDNKIKYMVISIIGVIGAIGSIVVFRKKK